MRGEGGPAWQGKLNINQSIAVARRPNNSGAAEEAEGLKRGGWRAGRREEKKEERGVGGGRAVWRDRARARETAEDRWQGTECRAQAVAEAGGGCARVRRGAAAGSLPPPPRGGSRARPPRPAQEAH